MEPRALDPADLVLPRAIQKEEEEIETKGKEQERLQAELKKMQRVKVFEPTMNFPLVQPLLGKDQEGDDKGKKKKKGKGKAGNERKKPAPAYILRCKDQWAEIKKSYDADFKEVSNALGAKWKTLSNEEKQPYEERYRQEKEAYLQVVGQEKREAEAMKLLDEEHMRWTAKELLEQYLKFRQEAEDGNRKKAKNKRKKEKDPSKPKQPMSAYFLYSQERHAALVAEKKSVPEISKITGEEWKGTTEAQKVPYEEVARKPKEEYQKQMEVYKQKKLELQLPLLHHTTGICPHGDNADAVLAHPWPVSMGLRAICLSSGQDIEDQHPSSPLLQLLDGGLWKLRCGYRTIEVQNFFLFQISLGRNTAVRLGRHCGAAGCPVHRRACSQSGGWTLVVGCAVHCCSPPSALQFARTCYNFKDRIPHHIFPPKIK